MKKFFLSALIASLSLFLQPVKAQSTVKINIEVQPAWGPTGYEQADYYYLPEINSYYEVAKKRYVYENDGRWKFSKTLPAKYKTHDVYKMYKVVINEPTPYKNNLRHRNEYQGYQNKHDQPVIRDSRDQKYFANKNHPQYKEWKTQQKNNKKQQSQAR